MFSRNAASLTVYYPEGADPVNLLQAVVVTDPVIISAVLDKASEVEKNSKAVYSKFNVVNLPKPVEA